MRTRNTRRPPTPILDPSQDVEEVERLYIVQVGVKRLKLTTRHATILKERLFRSYSEASRHYQAVLEWGSSVFWRDFSESALQIEVVPFEKATNFGFFARIVELKGGRLTPVKHHDSLCDETLTVGGDTVESLIESLDDLEEWRRKEVQLPTREGKPQRTPKVGSEPQPETPKLTSKEESWD